MLMFLRYKAWGAMLLCTEGARSRSTGTAAQSDGDPRDPAGRVMSACILFAAYTVSPFFCLSVLGRRSVRRQFYNVLRINCQ